MQPCWGCVIQEIVLSVIYVQPFQGCGEHLLSLGVIYFKPLRGWKEHNGKLLISYLFIGHFRIYHYFIQFSFIIDFI